MISWLVRKQIDRFEQKWNYDMRYGREVLDEAGLDALLPMNSLAKLYTYCRDVPTQVYYGAKVTAAIVADSAPCAQLVVDEAQRDGVDLVLLRALVEGRRDLLSELATLGFDLARGTLLRDGSDEEARAEILARWGRRGLVSVAYAITAAQAYPTLKYALGHGRACLFVRVGDADVSPRAVA
jgi:hypothetical protein